MTLSIFNKFIIFQWLILFSNLSINHYDLALLRITDYDIGLNIIRRKMNAMIREFAWFQKVLIEIKKEIGFGRKNYLIIRIRVLVLFLLFWISLIISDYLLKCYLFGFLYFLLFLGLYNCIECFLAFLYAYVILFLSLFLFLSYFLKLFTR